MTTSKNRTAEESEILGRTLFVNNFVNKYMSEYKVVPTSLEAHNDLFLVTKDEIIIVEIKLRKTNVVYSSMLLEEMKYNSLCDIYKELKQLCNKHINMLYCFVYEDGTIQTKSLKLNMGLSFYDKWHRKTNAYNYGKTNNFNNQMVLKSVTNLWNNKVWNN